MSLLNGGCLGDKTKDSVKKKERKKTVHASTLVAVAHRRMQRTAEERMGKGRVAGASAPLLFLAVH